MTGPAALERDRERALRRLENALKACGEVRLAIFGMGDSLCIYATEDLEGTGLDPNSYEARAAADYKHVQDHGAYWDSGGW